MASAIEWTDGTNRNGDTQESYVPGTFAFRVAVQTNDFNDEPLAPLIDVDLPHQCDAWVIARQLPHEEAKARLSAFINEASVALAMIDLAPRP